MKNHLGKIAIVLSVLPLFTFVINTSDSGMINSLAKIIMIWSIASGIFGLYVAVKKDKDQFEETLGIIAVVLSVIVLGISQLIKGLMGS